MKEVNTSIFSITTWAEFEQLFRNHFSFISATTEAINRLKRTAYYQESHIVHYSSQILL